MAGREHSCSRSIMRQPLKQCTDNQLAGAAAFRSMPHNVPAHLAQCRALGSTQPAAQLTQLRLQAPRAPLLLRLRFGCVIHMLEECQGRRADATLERQPAAGGGSRAGRRRGRTSWSVATCRRRRSSSASCSSWLPSLGLLTLAAAAAAACTASRRAQVATRRPGEPTSASRPSTLSLDVEPPGEGGIFGPVQATAVKLAGRDPSRCWLGWWLGAMETALDARR